MSGASCVNCGQPADGRLRVAVWEEEEKGRLSAKSAPLCVTCHAAFLNGRLSRVEVAKRFHAARDYRPAEWIGRVDRDSLLDVACLACGALLPVGEAPPAALACPRCGAENRFTERRGAGGTTRVTASLAAAPAEE
jgi:predicted RNA-binding Zn-ribbon protein involved in translation (DUF1610 family)